MRPAASFTAILAMVFCAPVSFLALGIASAQSTDKTSASCVAPEYRQFDFWIGRWEVFDPSGKKVGDSRIDRINDGCALLENWTGGGSVTGKSLNIYDSEDRQWHQFWVDSSSSRLMLDGKFADGKMILAGTKVDPKKPENAVIQRITWSRNGDGSVRQLWESSGDGGKKWTTAFDGKYVKAKAAAQ